MNKREFLTLCGAAGAATAGAALTTTSRAQEGADDGLSSLTDAAVPIDRAERERRLERASQLMGDNDIDAIVVEAGSALTYFTGIRWGRSERFTGAVITRDGAVAIVTPYFEEPSLRESLGIEAEVRTWHEHENPFDRVAEFVRDEGIRSGTIGVEETVRFFIADGIRNALPSFSVAPGNAVTRGCRMYKSAAEIALMQTASNVTIAAYEWLYSRVELGMESADISALMSDATRQLGGRPIFSSVLLNEASAYPHGTRQPQSVREGGVILMDCGADVHDYNSDISRTWVFGEPSKKQRDVWATAKQGQELALETAQIGVPAGRVDEVVRKFYESKGYGPGYQTPGLSHRLGHGIGMDGHEPINFVQGESTPLAPGMCFSDEPGIYIFGEFGVRLEDCLYMTEDGPRLFTEFSPSIDKPFG